MEQKRVRIYPPLFSTITKRISSFNNFTMVMLLIAFSVIGVFILATTSGIESDAFVAVPWLLTIINSLVNIPFLPLWIIALPIIGAIIQLLSNRYSEGMRDVSIVITTFFTLVLVLALYPNAVIEKLHFDFPSLMGLGLSFHIDMLGLTMLVLTSIIWFFVMIYSHEYVMFEKHRNRFYFFMAVTYSAILGTIMAGDLLTMFLFFEIMTFSSYMLVTHGQKSESFNAGYNYIFMGLIGGFAILLAMILLVTTVGHVRFIPLAQEMAQMGSVRYFIIGLLVFGFGIKAGMAPVHVWLPRAHPVAPTPASALLSGVMIKIGAFGILRVTTTYFFPSMSQISGVDDVLWLSAQNLGVGIIWLGIITMAIGVFFALQQANMKKMLAYHSISQMGYIMMGIGVALYLGYHGAMGYSGALYHIINHALFKSLLFMIAGVVYLHTHELNMYKLGGLWRKLPFTAFLALVAVFGITGMPLFNGFASKSILHHAIIESYEYGHASFRYAEVMFNIISAGTVCSFIKLFGFTFLGKMPDAFKSIQPNRFKSMHLAMLGIAVIIILVGLNPSYVMTAFILPALGQTTFDPYFINKYIVSMNFFNFKDMFGMVWIYALGASIFYFGIKYHWFHLKIPVWLNIEFIISYPFKKLMSVMCKIMGNCGCDDEVIELEKNAFNLIKEEEEHEPSFTERFVNTLSIFSNRYEPSIIKNDVLIYAVGLTIVLVVLMFVS
jgi:hydrogenase-4 component B